MLKRQGWSPPQQLPSFRWVKCLTSTLEPQPFLQCRGNRPWSLLPLGARNKTSFCLLRSLELQLVEPKMLPCHWGTGARGVITNNYSHPGVSMAIWGKTGNKWDELTAVFLSVGYQDGYQMNVRISTQMLSFISQSFPRDRLHTHFYIPRSTDYPNIFSPTTYSLWYSTKWFQESLLS